MAAGQFKALHGEVVAYADDVGQSQAQRQRVSDARLARSALSEQIRMCLVLQVQAGVAQISQCLKAKWPQASVHLSGSHAAGLALEKSAVDVVVLGLTL